MNNYHYIVASLPELSRDWASGDRDLDSFLAEIKENCSAKDIALIEFLERGYEEENLVPEFYEEAFRQSNAFLREWFRFDLNVRNEKVRYLNDALGRDREKDVICLDGGEFEQKQRLQSVLKGEDILARERGIDDLIWDKIDELTTFHYFDITVILGFIAKFKIIDRWMKLDEQTGREMFRRLVDEVRGTFKGVEFESSK